MLHRALDFWEMRSIRMRIALVLVTLLLAIMIVMTVIDVLSPRRHTNDPDPSPPAATSGPAHSS